MSIRAWFKRHGRAKNGSPAPAQFTPSKGPSKQSLGAMPQQESGLKPPDRETEIQAHENLTVAVSAGSNGTFLEQLWNDAYDALKESETELVEAYEKILTGYLRQPDSISKDPSVQENDIGPSRNQRRSQMERLVQTGLERTEKQVATTRKINDSIQIINSVRGIIEKSVRASPEATVAWAGVSLGIEIVMNPVSEALVNRQAINFVFDRMELYWDLHSLLLDESRAAESSANLRSQLERYIGRLYQKMLFIQMKSVCAYSSSTFKRLRRDFFKSDDWASQIKSMQDAENEVDRCSQQFNTEEARSRQRLLLNKLDNIHLALEKQYEQQEIFHKTKEDQQCLRDLYITDPSSDKRRIESAKGGLLQDAYCWITTHPDFQHWRTDPDPRLLWIKGDPGKGKTMLLCGIINELQKSKSTTDSLSFFFCQQTDSRLNNANSVLRGLIHSLATQKPRLTKYIRSRYDSTGKSLFEDANAYVAMSEILSEMLQSPDLTRTTLVIDALDECTTDRPRLLEFLTRALSWPSPVKWIISSRNLPSIEGPLNMTTHNIQLSLELNQDSTSRAIQAYIEHKVDWLRRIKGYDQRLSQTVRDYLVDNADGTFLWVGLVCHELGKEGVTRRSTEHKLKQFPPGLNPLFDRMLQQIDQSDDAPFCKRILAVVSVAYRPLTLEELIVSDQSLEDGLESLHDLEDVIANCGSFVATRNGSVYFVHQSAKDFLLRTAAILPSGQIKEHYNFALRSLHLLNKSLRRNIYSLDQGVLAGEIITPKPDPLAQMAYSCGYWMRHLIESMQLDGEQTDRPVPVDTLTSFFTKKFLHWVEVLSIFRATVQTIYQMLHFERHIQASTAPQELKDLIYDASRFTRYFKEGIEKRPLQVYSSGLIFSPMKSKTKQLYQQEAPSWLSTELEAPSDWDSCLQTIESHKSAVIEVASTGSYGCNFATTSQDGTVQVWHAVAGAPLATLEGSENHINSVTFTNYGNVASTSSGNTIKIWDIPTRTCVQTLAGHNDAVSSLSPVDFMNSNSHQLASASCDNTVKIWDVASGACLRTLHGHEGPVYSVSCEIDGSKLASASSDTAVKIWDAATGACLQTLQDHSETVLSVAFAPSGLQLASSSTDRTIRIWCAETWVCQQVISDHQAAVMSVSFSPDSQRVVSASMDRTVRIWDAATGTCLQILIGHSSFVYSAVFLTDAQQVASASFDNTIKIWNVERSSYDKKTPTSHSGPVMSVDLAPDGSRAASASRDTTIKIWDVATRECMLVLEGHEDWAWVVAFAPDSRHLASGSRDKTVRIWDATTGACLQKLQGHKKWVFTVAFAPDGRQVVSGSDDNTVRIWDTTTGACLQTLEGHHHTPPIDKVTFLSNGSQVASESSDGTTKIWDVTTGACLRTLERDSNDNVGPFFENNVRSRYGLSEDCAWVTYDGREILWLPTDFRPRTRKGASMIGRTVVVVTATGLVCVMKFK